MPVLLRKSIDTEAKALGISSSAFVRTVLASSLKTRGYGVGAVTIRDRRRKQKRKKRTKKS